MLLPLILASSRRCFSRSIAYNQLNRHYYSTTKMTATTRKFTDNNYKLLDPLFT